MTQSKPVPKLPLLKYLEMVAVVKDDLQELEKDFEIKYHLSPQILAEIVITLGILMLYEEVAQSSPLSPAQSGDLLGKRAVSVLNWLRDSYDLPQSCEIV